MTINDYFKAYIEGVCGKFGIADAAAPLQKGFDAFLESMGDAQAATDWKSEYGDGATTDHENSASGFYARKNEPIGFAILNDNVNMLDQLHSGKYTTKEPWNSRGFSEDLENEGSFTFNFDNAYEEEFVKDWERVIGANKDNQAALRKMLEFKPDFFVCPMDFMNAYHAGYAKDLLAKLLGNYFAAIDHKEDPYNSYLEWDGVTFGEMLDFLTSSSDNGSAPAVQESQQVLAEAHKDRTTGGNWFGKTLRDQNNYDRKVRNNHARKLYQPIEQMTEERFNHLTNLGDPEAAEQYAYYFKKPHGWDVADKTKTMGVTAPYDIPATVSAGKGSQQYDLGNDGMKDTGDNTGIAKTGRRSIKRFQDRLADRDLQLQLVDMENAKPALAVQESVEEDGIKFVEIDDFPSVFVAHFANGTWGDFVQYYGKNAIDDLKDIDAFMTSNGLCDIIPPSTEEWEATYNSFNSHPAFGLANSTVKVYGVPGEWTPLAPQYETEFAEKGMPS